MPVGYTPLCQCYMRVMVVNISILAYSTVPKRYFYIILYRFIFVCNSMLYYVSLLETVFTILCGNRLEKRLFIVKYIVT